MFTLELLMKQQVWVDSSSALYSHSPPEPQRRTDRPGEDEAVRGKRLQEDLNTHSLKAAVWPPNQQGETKHTGSSWSLPDSPVFVLFAEKDLKPSISI